MNLLACRCNVWCCTVMSSDKPVLVHELTDYYFIQRAFNYFACVIKLCSWADSTGDRECVSNHVAQRVCGQSARGMYGEYCENCSAYKTRVLCIIDFLPLSDWVNFSEAVMISLPVCHDWFLCDISVSVFSKTYFKSNGFFLITASTKCPVPCTACPNP